MTEQVNAQSVSVIKAKQKYVRGLEKSYDAAFQAATVANKWNEIAQAPNPSAELEIFCIGATDINYKDRSTAIIMLKKVKCHLIQLNITVLDAYEKRTLNDAIQFVLYREANHKVKEHTRQPESSEEGWEDRMDNAQAIIQCLVDKQLE